jgi:hypothetical protein
MPPKFTEAEVQRWAAMVDVVDGMSRDDVIQAVQELNGTPGLGEAVADELIGKRDGTFIPEALKRKRGEAPSDKTDAKPVADADKKPGELFEVVMDLYHPTIRVVTGIKPDGKTTFDSFRKARRVLLQALRTERARIAELRRTIRTWRSPPAPQG